MAEAWPGSLPNGTPEPAAYKTMRSLLPDEVEALVIGYEQGSTVLELAKMFDVHRTTVGKHLADRGVNTRPPALRSEDTGAIANLYQTGWSIMKIANKYQVAGDTISRRLRTAGVVMRGAHDRL